MEKELLKIKQDNDVVEMLFKLQVEEIEVTTEEKEKIIKENDLKSITHVDLNNQIEALVGISKEEKEELLTNLDIVLESRGLINTYECKKYYIAGINDALNIIFNEGNHKI